MKKPFVLSSADRRVSKGERLLMLRYGAARLLSMTGGAR